MITNEIGLNAGKIWALLNEEGEHPVRELKKKLDLKEPALYMALGWLAREGKIFHFKKGNKLLVELIQ